MKNLIIAIGCFFTICLAQAFPVLATCSFIFGWNPSICLILTVGSVAEIVLATAYFSFEIELK